MKLISFRIKKFKSVIDTGECRLSEADNILVLAGQNEAGKSAVLEALDFFENGPSKNFERLQRRKEEHPEVICRFLLNDPEIEEIFQVTHNEALKKFLQRNRIIGFVRGSINEDALDEIYFSGDTAELLKKFFPETDGESVKAEQQQKVQAEVVGGEEDKPSVNNLDGLEKFVLDKTRNFIFFDSFDALLPGVVTIAEVKKYLAVTDFEKVFGVDFTSIVKKEPRAIEREELRLQREAGDDLNKYWTQKLEEGGKYNFIVNIVPKTPAESASQIEFMVDRDDGNPLYIEQKSKGFRWFSAFNLRLRALGVEEGTIKNLVILVDEPGQGLHEKAQRDVKRVIEELGERGAQIIYATHHANLIGTEGKEFARIRVVSNSRELGTKVETVAQFASRADQGAKDALSPLVTAMGIHSVGSLLDAKRLNVVVEGISDHYYFSSFKKLLNKDERLYFLPACGVNNVPNLVSVLIGWGCNYKAVFDDDAQSGRRAYTQLKNEFYEKDDNLAHEHILKIQDCNGVEDILDSQDFYRFVLDQPFPRGKALEKNSKLAEGRKDVLARMFLEKVEVGSVSLSTRSVKRINEIFEWLYNKFHITGSSTMQV